MDKRNLEISTTLNGGNNCCRYSILEFGYEQIYYSSDDIEDIKETITEYREEDTQNGTYKRYVIRDNKVDDYWLV